MPALPVVPKVIKTALIWDDGVNTDIVTRFYTEYAGSAPSNSELVTFATDLHTAYVASLGFAQNEAITLDDIHCIDLSSATGAEGGDASTYAGTGSDPPNAADVAFVISYEIARRYRGGHARGYWPLGQATALSNPQTWDPTFRSAVQTNAELFFADVAAAGWSGSGALQHVNVSYFTGFTVVTDPITGRARNVPTVRGTPLIDPVTSYIARGRVGTQRRRLQYG